MKILDWKDAPCGPSDAKELLDARTTFWAKPEVMSASMFFGSAQVDEVITHRFWLRSVKGATDVMSLNGRTKLAYNGGIYRIKRVSDFQERHVWTIVDAELLGAKDFV